MSQNSPFVAHQRNKNMNVHERKENSLLLQNMNGS